MARSSVLSLEDHCVHLQFDVALCRVDNNDVCAGVMEMSALRVDRRKKMLDAAGKAVQARLDSSAEPSSQVNSCTPCQ